MTWGSSSAFVLRERSLRGELAQKSCLYEGTELVRAQHISRIERIQTDPEWQTTSHIGLKGWAGATADLLKERSRRRELAQRSCLYEGVTVIYRSSIHTNKDRPQTNVLRQ